MAQPSINLDLDVLRIILVVRETGSVTGAAHRLQRAQSTISYALNCARRAFDDELFVREGRRLVPTPRCLDLLPRIEGVAHELQFILAPEQFDPERHAAEITLSCNQYEQILFLPALIAKARHEAPNLRLRIIRSHTGGTEQLLSGECDLLLTPLTADRLDVFGTTLLSDRYVCVSDARNALPPAGLSIDDYQRHNHVSITHGGYWRPFFFRLLPDMDKSAIRVELCSATNLFEVLSGTDLVATIPSRLAARLPQGLAVVPSPFPATFDIHMFHTRRTRSHPAAKWVRDAVLQIARAQPALASA